jgi:hypothetical protein
VAEPVELLGADPGHHVLADHVEHVGGQAPGGAHLLLLFGVLIVICMVRNIGARGGSMGFRPVSIVRTRTFMV